LPSYFRVSNRPHKDSKLRTECKGNKEEKADGKPIIQLKGLPEKRLGKGKLASDRQHSAKATATSADSILSKQEKKKKAKAMQNAPFYRVLRKLLIPTYLQTRK
jgi:predicted mannosyl-3-phosphoglycerate phosphatase (HAD superfamily)